MARVDPVELAHQYLSDEARGEWAADDYDPIHEAVFDALDEKFGDKGIALLAAYRDIEAQFVRGRRCSVCGMTSRQAAAANYDCVREC